MTPSKIPDDPSPDEIPDDPSPDERIRASARLSVAQISVDIYNAVKEHELELNRATAAFEHAALRPGVLLNGGAATAFITLLGAITKSEDESGSGVSLAFCEASVAVGSWIGGLIFACIAIAFGWLSQRSYTRHMKRQRAALEYKLAREDTISKNKYDTSLKNARWGKRFQYTAMFIAGASYLLFIFGVLSALDSIASTFEPSPSVLPSLDFLCPPEQAASRSC